MPYCKREDGKHHKDNSKKLLWEFGGRWDDFQQAFPDIPQDFVLDIIHSFIYSVNIYWVSTVCQALSLGSHPSPWFQLHEDDLDFQLPIKIFLAWKGKYLISQKSHLKSQCFLLTLICAHSCANHYGQGNIILKFSHDGSHLLPKSEG